MPDSRFFTRRAPQTLATIVERAGCRVHPDQADRSREFTDIAPLESATAETVSFLDNPKYVSAFSNSKAGACFVSQRHLSRAPQQMILLLTETPYAAYALVAQLFYPEIAPTPSLSPQAFIDPTARIGQGCRIEAGAHIGAYAVIGEHCHIGVNSVVGDHVILGNHCDIGPLSSISHSIISNHVRIHRGVHIGQDGFGYAPSAQGVLKVPQVGRVLIADYVEIGSGTCIDRGSGADTTIGAHTKIDNLVQIGHNCQIGSYVFIAGQAGIAGSTRIEDGAMVGGQAGSAGHITIGKNAKIAAQSGLMTDVPAGETYGGFPAVPIRQWHRQTTFIKNASVKKAD